MNKFFALAKTAAKKSNHHTYKIGAVLTKRKKIIAIGSNNMKTHPLSNHPFKSLHAEMAAIICGFQFGGGDTVYLYRETKDGIPALARPCEYCMEFLKEYGITTVCYTTNGSFGAEKLGE